MIRHMLSALAGFVFMTLAAAAHAAPLEAYSRLPAISDVDLSDDGTMLAYVVSRDERQRVVVQSVEGQILRQVDFQESKIRSITWAGNDHVLITRSTTTTLQGRMRRGEFGQTVSLNVRNGEMIRLLRDFLGRTRYENIVFGLPVPAVWEGEDVALVMAYTDTWPGRLDVVRVNLDTGMSREHFSGYEDSAGYLIQHDGNVLTRESYLQLTGAYSLDVHEGQSWRTLYRTTGLIDAPHVMGLSADGASIIMSLWDEGNSEWRSTPVSIATGEVGAPLFQLGLNGIVTDRMRRMIGHWSRRGAHDFRTYSFLDPALQASWTRLAQSFPGQEVSLVANTPDYSKLVVAISGPEYAGDYFLYDIAAQSLSLIGRQYPDIPNAELAEVRRITYAAADGLQIPAYLTLPVGREARALPLIVLAHGGPQSRDYGDFDWMAQGLASRGYAVLQANFRGSGGLGTAFREAGYGQWGRKMQTDLSDGVAYLAQQGSVDQQRVCIMGASYGGYAALAGVTVQSGIYRCAVSIAGVADIADLTRRSVLEEGSRTAETRYLLRYLGAERYDDPSLAEISPVLRAANGNAPVLLIHGRDDTIVLYSHSTTMEAALRRANRPVELVPLSAEDHGLSREATRAQTMAAAVGFLERYNPPN
jgi:dipeptidyl aminopeptidase/acylaminoacyl peptidase